MPDTPQWRASWSVRLGVPQREPTSVNFAITYCFLHLFRHLFCLTAVAFRTYWALILGAKYPSLNK